MRWIWFVSVLLFLAVPPVFAQGASGTALDPTITLPLNSVQGAVWNADESQLLTWAGSSVYIWDTTTFEGPPTTFDTGATVYSASWNPDESRILTTGAYAIVWNADPAAPSFGKDVFRAALDSDANGGAMWSPDGTRILTWNASTASVYDAASGEMIWSTDVADFMGMITGGFWSADNITAVIWTLYGFAWFNNVSTYSGFMLPNAFDPVLSADETRLLGVGGLSLTLWDTTTQKKINELPMDDVPLHAIWNSDETRILGWGSDGTARVWDASTGEELLRLQHDGWVWGATWNNDESRILSWSWDGTARVWDAQTGKQIFALQHDNRLDLNAAQWNPGNTMIATHTRANDTIFIWDSATGKPLFTLPHDDVVKGVIWSTGQSRLLSWTESAVYIWDVPE